MTLRGLFQSIFGKGAQSTGANYPAYYKTLMRKGKKVYKGYFLPRVQAILGGDTAQTKGDSITFGTSATSFTVFKANSDDWRITHEFATEAEVVEWCDKKLEHKADPAA